MDRYQRVEKPREESPLGPNEIRITAQGRPRNYITYALALLQDNETDEIVIKAMGRAINKTIIIVELLKRRIAGLHQNTSIESLDITDTWEPLEEGLVTLETTRHVSLITIKLSKKELDTLSPGYQPPIPADQVRPVNDLREDADAVPSAGPVNDLGEDADAVPSGGPVPSHRGRGRGRGGRSRERGYNNGGADYGPDQVRPANDLSDDADAVPSGGAVPSGRGRGHGRGGRSRERGYNNGGADYDDENGYLQEAPRGYRGRGRGQGRRGPGRGYGGNGYAMEEAGGYNDVEYYNAPPVQGHDGGQGRGRGRGRGGRGRGPPPQE